MNVLLFYSNLNVVLLCSSEPRKQIQYSQSSKLSLKTPERRQQRRFDVFSINFEHISYLLLVFLLLNLNMQLFIESTVQLQQGNTTFIEIQEKTNLK